MVSVFVESGSIELKLNGESLLKGSGRIERFLSSNTEQKLSWKINGPVGSSYTISVSSPKEAEFHLSKVLTVSKEQSSHTFTT